MQARALEEWLLIQWRDSPSRPTYAIMAEILALLRANAR